jgi:PEP-CTERM motif-containing protein
MRPCFRPAVVISVFLMAAPVGAAPIGWVMDGTVTVSPEGNPLHGVLPLGTAVDFQVSLDSGAPDLCDAAGAGLYQAPSGMVTVGDNSYTASSAWLEVSNPDGSCVASPSGTTLRMFFDTAPFSAAVIGWGAGGESLPLDAPDTALFWFAYADRAPMVLGEIGPTAEMPEPSTLLLMLPGLAAIGARRRITRRAR